jgi:MoxR-like ATPase
LTAAKARAAAEGRTSAALEDVVWLAPYVLSHRVSADDKSPKHGTYGWWKKEMEYQGKQRDAPQLAEVW